jgi:[acyl-carrier-protein] S-malonyltransferase
VAEKEIGFKPAVAAGHSLGEYSALVAANAIPLKTATQWVRERGAAMQKAVPLGEGTMAAVLGLDDSRVEALCKKAQELSSSVVEPANFNSPGQVVIAGATPGIQKAIELAKTDSDFKGAKAMALAVSAPFHCSLMKPAREHMAAVFQKAKPSPLSSPLFPYVPNRTARMHQEKGVILELLIDQIDHPVLWKQSIEHLLQEGFRNAIEFGPGKVLQGLMKRISLSDGSVMRGISMNESSHLKIIEEALR